MVDIPSDKKAKRQRRQSDQVRLESWKAIANYFGRSVRTVRRWEKSEELPVRRHRHTKGYSVYAYQAELDRWRREHQNSVDQSRDLPDQHDRRKGDRWHHIAAVLIVGVVIGGAADRYVLQTRQTQNSLIATLDLAAYGPEGVAQTQVAPIFDFWADGRVREAFRESQNVVERLPGFPPEIQTQLVEQLVVLSLDLGRIADARMLVADLPEGAPRIGLDARISFAAGNMESVSEVLKHGENSDPYSRAQSDVLLGMAAVSSGNFREAKALLQNATSELAVEDEGYFFVALDLLAGVLQSEGNLAGSIEILERTMPQRHAAARYRSGLFWLMCQRRLANLYREAGKNSLAEQVESELRDLLIFADEDFPLAQSLGGA